MNKFTCTLAATLAALLALPAFAADTAPAAYDPLQTFAPFTYPQAANAMRDASGKPGPSFWQNRADYRIEATLDPATRRLSGSEVISYTNHSPDTLPVLWLQIEQNRYRKDARGAFGGGNSPASSPTVSTSARSRWRMPAATGRRRTGWSATPACRSPCPPR
ncbi:Peptidase M1 OS=Rhodanobacter lindaniclasticus OX=75310 GN=B1991_15860 PE=4 SV=1 [Rhodanobacter lindaniclasticus]